MRAKSMISKTRRKSPSPCEYGRSVEWGDFFGQTRAAVNTQGWYKVTPDTAEFDLADLSTKESSGWKVSAATRSLTFATGQL